MITEYKVELFSKVTFVYVNLYGLNDSSVKEILIKNIKSIKFKGGGFWNVVFIGTGTAFVLGYVTIALADTADEEFKNRSDFLNGLLVRTAFALPLVLIGGVIGTETPKNHIYNFKMADIEATKIKLKYIFKNYSNRYR